MLDGDPMCDTLDSCLAAIAGRFVAFADPAALAPLAAVVAAGQALDTVALRVQREDGRERQCLVSADPPNIGDAPHVFCIVHDVTEQLERDAALRQGYDALARLARVARRPLPRQAVDMEALARDSWLLLIAAHPERHVDWRIDPLPAAQGDPDLAAQVWQNLLDNAMKYSAQADPARVLVDSYGNERGTWYRLTDNGAGFDMAKAGGLFLPFQRMHPATQFAGTGVGLSLVRRIVEQHQGEIRLRSNVGVGTVVEFTLDPPPAPG